MKYLPRLAGSVGRLSTYRLFHASPFGKSGKVVRITVTPASRWTPAPATR